MAASSVPSSNTLKLQTNLPEVIALQFAGGLPVTSDYTGDQVMYTLTDGRKLYLHPTVADKITAAGIGAREQFAICKREVTRGNRRTVEYTIEKLNGTPAAGAQNPTPATAPAAVVENVRPQNTIHAVTPAPVGEVPAVFAAHTMAVCYQSAVDVALGAMAYAKDRGLLLTPSFEDVRAMAATFFISETRAGRA